MVLSEKAKVFYIAAVSLVAAGAFALISSSMAGFDPAQYDRLGLNLASGNGFSLEEKPPYSPTMFREPMYAAFIALIYRIFGHNVKLVVFSQILLHCLTALTLYAIAKTVFSGRTAFASGILAAVFPTLANTSSYLMSETFFAFLLCLGAYLLMRSFFVAAGLIFGMLILTKTAALALPIFLAAALIAAGLKRRVRFGRLLLGSASFIIACFIVVSLWSARNKDLFGTYSLTLRGGDVIWSRAEKLDDPPREVLATAVYSFSEYLGAGLFPDMAARFNRYLYKDLDRASVLEDRLAKEGMPRHEIDALLKKEAICRISAHPFRYLAYTPVEAIKMTAFSYLPFLNEERVASYFASITHGGPMLSALKGGLRFLAYPVILLSLFGMARSLDIWDRWILLFVVILYFNVAYSLLDAIGRYAVPLIPFYCLFAASAFRNASRGRAA